MENNTLNENASSDCGGKDAKTASFPMKSGFKQKWICEEVRSAKRRLENRPPTTPRSAARANRG
jgi:hypothetical protein